MSYIPNVYYRHPQTGVEYDYDPVNCYWVERVYDPYYADPYYAQQQAYAPQGYVDPYYNQAYAQQAYAQQAYADPRYAHAYADPYYAQQQAYADPRYADQAYVDPYAVVDYGNDPRSGAARPLGPDGRPLPGGHVYGQAEAAYEDIVALKRGRVQANKRLPPKVGDPYKVLEKADGRTAAADPKMLGSTSQMPVFNSKEERMAWHREHMQQYLETPEYDPRDALEGEGPVYAKASATAWMKPERLNRLNAMLSQGKQPMYDEAKAKEYASMRFSTDPEKPKVSDFDRSSLGVDLSRWKKGRAGAELRTAQACAVSKGYVDRNYRDE